MSVDHTMKCPRCGGTGEITLRGLRVGDLILAVRTEKGMTQQDLSAKAGIARSQIANVETGRSDMPLKTLARVAAALGVRTRDLVP